MHKRAYLFLLSFLIISIGVAQNITPKGIFLKDSVQIGEHLPFVLSIKYPKELELIFPDSLHDFAPFEITHKTYFPTKSDSVFSIDSTIYYLSTFEIDTVQYLKMPVYLINDFDSTILWTPLDSVILNQVVTSIPDTLAMIINTEYVDVPMAFNYPYATIGLIVGIILVFAIWFIFGKTIKRKIVIYQLKKRNLKFIELFDQLVKVDYLACEPILILWKSYIQKLKGLPFTTLTTKEIVHMSSEIEIEEALIAIDKNIYGPKDATLLTNAYQDIRKMAMDEYHDKVNQITHG